MNVLQKIQSELKAPKGQYNSFGKFHYRSCEDIVEALKPILAAHEVSLTISDEVVAVGSSVESQRFYVKANAMLWKDGKCIGEAFGWAREQAVKKGMDESQVTGSASSYARKYALNGLLAIDDTKDADSKESAKQGAREQINPEPINQAKVDNAVIFFKAQIDRDSIEDTYEGVQTCARTLTNDEKIAVADRLGDKAPDSNKMYKSILK